MVDHLLSSEPWNSNKRTKEEMPNASSDWFEDILCIKWNGTIPIERDIECGSKGLRGWKGGDGGCEKDRSVSWMNRRQSSWGLLIPRRISCCTLFTQVAHCSIYVQYPSLPNQNDLHSVADFTFLVHKPTTWTNTIIHCFVWIETLPCWKVFKNL